MLLKFFYDGADRRTRFNYERWREFDCAYPLAKEIFAYQAWDLNASPAET